MTTRRAYSSLMRACLPRGPSARIVLACLVATFSFLEQDADQGVAAPELEIFKTWLRQKHAG